jgi:hypothetical protein
MSTTGIARGKIIMPDLSVVTYADKPGHLFHDPWVFDAAQLGELLDARMTLTYMTAAVANAQSACLTVTGVFMSIHTASPGNTGANEIVGNTGYTGTRPAITWAGTATNGVNTSTNTQTYPMLVVEAGGIPYFGLWTAATGGTFIFGSPTSGLSGSIPISANVTFTSSVVLTSSG